MHQIVSNKSIPGKAISVLGSTLRLSLLLALLGFSVAHLAAQGKGASKALLQDAQVEKDVRFLADDRLKGRDTPSAGLDSAAAYIARRFRVLGLKAIDADADYMAPVQLEMLKPARGSFVVLGKDTLLHGSSAIVLGGTKLDLDAPVIYAGYADKDELEKLDVKGKIVLSISGSEQVQQAQTMYRMAYDKAAYLEEAGALALVELYQGRSPFGMLVNYFNQDQLRLAESGEESSNFPVFWVNTAKESFIASAKTVDAQMKMMLTGEQKSPVSSANVIGMIEGKDPKLKAEAIVVTAHYDHVGVDPDRPGDSIYNGARDNALGVAALLRTAAEISAQSTARSTIFIAFTAEEKGLLGSEYYVEKPDFPLSQTVFNVNMDGAGYNDTTVVTLNGFGRTSAHEAILAAGARHGLQAIADPVPEQQLFDRSDNASFARKGVPALNVAPGFRGLDEALMAYYHQPQDEVESLNFNYVLRYAKTVASIVQAVANLPERPRWVAGDKYEAAFEELYQQR